MEAPVVKGVSSTNIRRALAEGDYSSGGTDAWQAFLNQRHCNTRA